MKKYLQLFSLSWQNGLVYRTSLALWRIRQLLSTVMSLTVWSVLFTSTTSVFAYSREQMITYVFLVSALQSIILTTALHGLAGDIYSGKLSTLLLKPVNVFWYQFTVDIADKAKNVVFFLAETGVLFLIYHPLLAVPTTPLILATIYTTVVGLLINFFVMLLFGSFGFWSPETWGPRFLFFMIIDFSAGKLFPLDILPQTARTILQFTPFPYYAYHQSQIFLGKYSPAEVLSHIVVSTVWLGVLATLSLWIWKKGIKDYAAAGN